MELPPRRADRFRVPAFSTDRTWEDDVAITTVTGDLDLVSARALRRALADVRAPALVDLTRCGFLDSTGLSVILEVQQRIGAGFALVVSPGSAVARTLELSIGELLPIHPSRAPAVRAARAASA